MWPLSGIMSNAYYRLPTAAEHFFIALIQTLAFYLLKARIGMELYIKNIAHRWRKEMSRVTEKTYILSPYITSSTADSVLAHLDESACLPEIYTIFSAELFASKASSLRTLKKMVHQGCSLYHLPNLHAKIVLIPETFASIGSQNLTLAGTRNKEASVALLDPKVIKRLEKELLPWLEERIPITSEMIADMAQLLGNVEDLFDAAKTAAEELDKRVREQQATRDEAARLAREAAEEAARRAQAEADARRIAEEENAARMRQQAIDLWRAKKEEERLRNLEAENRRVAEQAQQRRYQQLESYLKTAKVASNVAYGAIRHLNYNWPGNGIYSLLADAQFHLTSWRTANGITVSLKRGRRYLTLQEDNGRLGWSRVMNTRISFISSGVSFSDPVWFENELIYIDASGDWAQQPKIGRNTYLTVKNNEQEVVCEVSGWFDLNSVELLDISPPNTAETSTAEHNYYSSIILRNIEEFRNIWLRLITTPFQYTSERVGVNAEQFFGQEGEHFKIRLAFTKDNPILLVRSLGY